MTFEDINIHKDILKAIGELGFVNPTPIQAETIPHLLENSDQDILGFAQTGTGKTAAFGLPIIQQIDTDSNQTQSIVLAPTRELCMQIAKDLESYSKYTKHLNVVAVYGGASIDTQIRALGRGAHIVVGTPGRTLDLIKRRKLKLHNVQWLVLDEADEMLNMGFKEELDNILSETPETKQTLLFSATMPKEVARIAKEYMKNSKEIRVGEKNAGAENVEHAYYVVRASDKYAALKRIADINPNIYGIVFCRTRRDTKEVADKLIEDGYNADALHGDLSQSQRDMVMQRFRQGSLQILVATDVAARGLDVNSLTHIINFNLPDDLEVYIHRSGRTGRAGNKGISITIAHSRELSKIRTLERMVKKPFKKERIPSGVEIVEKRLINLIDNIKHTVVDEKKIAPYLDDILQKLEELSREELIKKLVSVEFTRFLEYYKGAKDINFEGSESRGRDRDRDRSRGRDRDYDKGGAGDRSRKERRSESRGKGKFSRFYINLGTKANINPATLIGIINDVTDNREIGIGRIELMKKFSFFEVDSHYEKEIVKSFQDVGYKGQSIIVELSNPKQESTTDRYEKRHNTFERSRGSKSSGRRKDKGFDRKQKGKRRK
ncbi:MAG: ATP-dependent helicase [Bacteroidetes bacterium]|nr:MAG: ATP-dependent helicase [Bacteroidota bacterium]